MARLPLCIPFGFADDVSIILQEFFQHFVELAAIIELLSNATALMLNMQKCVLVPLRLQADLQQWRRIVRALAPSWRSCAVARNARYLGVFIGHCFDSLIWQKPLSEYVARVHAINALSGSWCSQVHSYCTYAVSVLTYVMQFVHLPKQLYGDKTRYLAKVLKTPRNAIPREAAYHLQLVQHKPLPDLHALNRAIMARAWLGFGASNKAEQLLTSSLLDMDFFIDPVSSWASTSMIATMAANYQYLHTIREVDLQAEPRPQRVAYQLLRGSPDIDAFLHAVAHRLCVLDSDVAEGMHDKKVSAEIVLGHIQCCKPHSQPSGVQAWIRAVFNAWTTHGRYGSEHPCVFCCAPDGDRLEHYAACTVLAFYGQELVPHLWEAGYRMEGIETFLGADAQFVDLERACVLVASWFDAVHTTAIAYSRGRGHGPPVQYLAARLKVYAIKFGKGSKSMKWLTEGICPSKASMAQWT